MLGPRKDVISWDECFMRMAKVIAERSKDPVTQTGAVIVNTDNVVVGMGYNGLPRGIDNNKFPWDREGDFLDTKYAYVAHSEENAIFNANNSVKGCKIYSTLYPCGDCAKSIIQTGIKEVVYESDKHHDLPIWEVARRLFDAAGIKCRQYKSDWSK